MKISHLLLPLVAAIGFSPMSATAAIATFSGRYVDGEGDVAQLEALDAAFESTRPSARMACLPLLYKRDWNGFVEAPSWPGWWIQNSFGATYGLQPFHGEEPYASWIANSQDLWFRFIGDGKQKGMAGLVGPEGCLCDAAAVTLNGGTQNGFGDFRHPSTRELPVDGKVLSHWVAFKQGDANAQHSDWFVGANAAALVMESDRLLFRRDIAAARARLPYLKRTAAFIESRRDPKTDLILCGRNSNLLAPSYAGVKNPDGSYGFGLLTEVAVNYAAGLDRLAEVCDFVGDNPASADYRATSAKVKTGLKRMMTPEGYFIRAEDPDGTRRGVFGAPKHGYFEAHPNQDAGAFRVTSDAENARIVDFMLHKVKGDAKPGSLIPNGLVLPNYPGYDDHSGEGNMAYGAWNNGASWPAHDGIFGIACFRAGEYAQPFRAFAAMRPLMEAHRNDAPLSAWGLTPWGNQLNKPHCFCYDSWGPVGGLVRGLFEYAPSAKGLRLWPHVPPAITRYLQKIPIVFGKTKIHMTSTGTGTVTKAIVNGKPAALDADGSLFLSLPADSTAATLSVEFLRGDAAPRGVSLAPPADLVPATADTGFWQDAPPEFTAARDFLAAMKQAGLGESFEAGQARLAIELLAVARERKAIRTAGKLVIPDLQQSHHIPPPDLDKVDELYRNNARWILGGLQDHLNGISYHRLPVAPAVLKLARETKLVREDGGGVVRIAPGGATAPRVLSPDGTMAITVRANGPLAYAVTVDGKPLLADSPLGLVFKDGLELGKNTRVTGVDTRSVDTKWQNGFGKCSVVRDQFNETRVHLREERDGAAPVDFDLVVRAYDDGVALRYDMPKQASLGSFTLTRDKTAFTFPQDARCLGGEWSNCGELHYPENRLAKLPESQMCLPIVVQVPGAMVALAEADVRDWSCSFLKHGSDRKTLFASPVLTGSSPACAVDVDVSGLDLLVLETSTGGDAFDFDHTVWADARLVRADGTEMPLSSLKPTASSQGYGALETDATVDKKPICLRGQTYQRGLGTHSPGRIEYTLKTGGAPFLRFKAVAGIADETGGKGSAEFRVSGAGQPATITLAADLAGDVVSQTPRATPWHVAMIARKPGGLVESNIIANLATPSQLQDTSWIKPGIMAWDKWWSIDGYGNLASDMEYVDLAADMGWPYMLVDWGWCTPVMPEPCALDPKAELTVNKDALDLPALFEHAKKKNVKLILWLHSNNVNRIGIEKTLAACAKMGAAGVKIDFMNRSDQGIVKWYEEVLATAAKHRLLVNFHGAYVPTGLARTWPNYITQEGILGNEYSKFGSCHPGTKMACDPKHHITLPFTRGLLGPGDFTPGGFLNRTIKDWRGGSPTQVMGTRARQLALAAVIDSPLLCMADSPANYRTKDGFAPGLEFFRDLPTVWDETRVLSANLAEHIVEARRKGNAWVVAAMNDDKPLTLKVPLDFLKEGEYTVRVFADKPEWETTPAEITDEVRTVKAGDILEIMMATHGGFAAKIERNK